MFIGKKYIYKRGNYLKYGECNDRYNKDVNYFCSIKVR